jgi:hypothetical protein
MKYIAFVDTLGFKNRVTHITQQEAIQVIVDFNANIYRLWDRFGYNHDQTITGRTFSDSFIIHTENNNPTDLKKILNFLLELFKISITTLDLPLRGGIAEGDYDDLPELEFDNLHKGLIIGNGFIDAYLLESNKDIKGSKLLFKLNIKNSIEKIHNYKGSTKEAGRLENGELLYEIKWGNIDFLTQNDFAALNSFINLAVESKWLDHYYYTLDTFLSSEPQETKREIFRRIIERIQARNNYVIMDDFITNFLKTEGIIHLKKSFLSYIRARL